MGCRDEPLDLARTSLVRTSFIRTNVVAPKEKAGRCSFDIFFVLLQLKFHSKQKNRKKRSSVKKTRTHFEKKIQDGRHDTSHVTSHVTKRDVIAADPE